MGIQILLGGVIGMSIQPNMQRLMEEVRDGKLDFALTKPEDSQVLVSIREVRIWRSVDIVSGAVVLAYGVARLDREVGIADVAPLRRAPRRGCADDLLLLGSHLDARLLDRQRLGNRRALPGHLPDRPLSRLDLPHVAAVRPDVPRPDRVRDHRAGRGGDLAARLGRRSRSRSASASCSSSSRAAGGGSGSGSTRAPRPSAQCCASNVPNSSRRALQISPTVQPARKRLAHRRHQVLAAGRRRGAPRPAPPRRRGVALGTNALESAAPDAPRPRDRAGAAPPPRRPAPRSGSRRR